MAQQVGATGMGVDVGGVGDVKAGLLEPADQLNLPAEELALAVAGVRPVEGDLDGTGGPRDGVGPVAVELVEALAGQPVIRIVVVRLVGVDPLLVEKRRRPSVADREVHVVLPAAGIGQHRQVDAAGPVTADGEAVARRPPARDHAGAGIGNAGRLGGPVERPVVQAQPASQSAVPADAVDIDRVGLGRVDRYEEAEAAARHHAHGGGIALDLAVDVVRGFRQTPG